MSQKMTTEIGEIRRLTRIYKNLQPKAKALAAGLIAEAARLRVQLDLLNADIAENGLTELFQQSDKVEPYTRARPQADLFIKVDKSYQAIIKQLNDMLPPEQEAADELADFLGGDS